MSIIGMSLPSETPSSKTVADQLPDAGPSAANSLNTPESDTGFVSSSEDDPAPGQAQGEEELLCPSCWTGKETELVPGPSSGEDTASGGSSRTNSLSDEDICSAQKNGLQTRSYSGLGDGKSYGETVAFHEELLSVPEGIVVEANDSAGFETRTGLNNREFITRQASSEVCKLCLDKDKHFLILSEAGKPIYSHHGNEEDWSSTMAVVQALVSSAVSLNQTTDTLRTICSDHIKLSYLHRPPLILVGFSRIPDEPTAHIELQLHYLHSQILMLLTETILHRIFRRKANYDLRRLLTGSDERSLDEIVNRCDSDLSITMAAVRCLPVPAAVRDVVGNAMAACASKLKSLAFMLLFVNFELISLARMKNCLLHPEDLHLIFSHIQSNLSYQQHTVTWTPMCLPRFNKTGSFYVRVSYLTEDCPAWLLLFSNDRDSFDQVTAVSQALTAKLQSKGKTMESLQESIRSRIDSGCCLSSSDYSASLSSSSDLWHFVYKNRGSSQFTSPQPGPPYFDVVERCRLFRLYIRVITFMTTDPVGLKIYFWAGPFEAILGWRTKNFELLAAFSPLVTKQAAIGLVDRLMKWLKKEESKLFILNAPTWAG